MIRKNEWEEFFDGHAPVYMDNSFTKNTMKEVDFILDELNLPPGCCILDMGCGTGRHSIELARRGYQVIGVDISSGMLTEAKKAAREARANGYDQHMKQTVTSFDRKKLPPKVDTNNAHSMFDKNLL